MSVELHSSFLCLGINFISALRGYPKILSLGDKKKATKRESKMPKTEEEFYSASFWMHLKPFKILIPSLSMGII